MSSLLWIFSIIVIFYLARRRELPQKNDGCCSPLSQKKPHTPFYQKSGSNQQIKSDISAIPDAEYEVVLEETQK